VRVSPWCPSELQDAQKRIKRLEAALGRKTLENEILKEAVDFAKAKKWIARSPALLSLP
jgi:transposase